ncbi:pyruvate carboxylase [Alphaproteobacteria bacterium]|nr:pyruvate carboxylase [Alphaproteobacteria bacterium]
MKNYSKKKLKKVLVSNRGEIAIRIFRAATELGLKTVAVYSQEDRFALHRFKADEAYLIGEGKSPVQAYMDIEEVIRIAKHSNVDCIHPGYGFLSENPDFAEAVLKNNIQFVGPTPNVMRMLGNKINARSIANDAGVKVMPASECLPEEEKEIIKIAQKIGYPLMLKASWGGGGRGMRVIENESKLIESINSGKREAKNAFGSDEVYLEKLVRKAKHVEVQVLGDIYGNIVHLYERDCSMQRRNQKVVERAPANYLSKEQREALCNSAISLVKEVNYSCAGTVEFLLDLESKEFYFIEVNPRIQVEHTVTEEVTGIDLIKSQIRVIEGYKIGDESGFLPKQESISLNGHALQCRITTEDPENKFIPDYGRITAYRGATGFGIRLDGGTAYSGAVITSNYDSLLEKLTVWASTPLEAVKRMERALREFRIRGVKTNLIFLEALIGNEKFINWKYTTKFIDETPSLFEFPKRRDRATRILSFIADTIVNGNSEMIGRKKPENYAKSINLPSVSENNKLSGTKQIFDKLGSEKFSKWILDQNRLLVTDTTFRDAHQSLLATRLRTIDMLKVAPIYNQLLPNLFSLECWGGATFDVSMRFLKEDPWDRIIKIRKLVPNILTQMLLRSANAVGYKNYPDNVVKYFINQSAEAGIDIFRIFDCLNSVENMKMSIEAVCETGKICEAAVCYSGDLSDTNEDIYTLNYYINKAKELERFGAHIIAIKDMAGLCKPKAATKLFSALKNEISLPIHFHTHDTSGISSASVIAAADSGVDIIDGASDSMSGLTSQPNLGSIVESFRLTNRDTELDKGGLRKIANYWEEVRKFYQPFESDLRSGMADVYEHEMPGGQYTNLREQARAVGINNSRWTEVTKAYSDVNKIFGNIVKVTPTSKVVGDLALHMVANNLNRESIEDENIDITFPASVVELMKGELGTPDKGWPTSFQSKVLRGESAIKGLPGKNLKPINLLKAKSEVEKKVHRQVSDYELASYLMYPRVFIDYANHRRQFSDVSVIPTPTFFYGPDEDDEILLDIEKGKTLIVRRLAVGEANESGERNVFFELNGQPRTISVKDKALLSHTNQHPKADTLDKSNLGSPLPGLIVSISISEGQKIKKSEAILTIESMKMETIIYSEIDGEIEKIYVNSGSRVEVQDLLVKFKN